MLTALIIPVAAAAAVLAAQWLIGALPAGLPTCPMLRITGLRCPLCGGTHAVLALVRGELWKAVRYNPLVTAAVLPCLWMYLRLIFSCLAREYIPFRPRFGKAALIVMAAMVLIFTVVRNTPVYKAYLY